MLRLLYDHATGILIYKMAYLEYESTVTLLEVNNNTIFSLIDDLKKYKEGAISGIIFDSHDNYSEISKVELEHSVNQLRLRFNLLMDERFRNTT